MSHPRTAVVTGAIGGIGSVIVERLAAAGHNIASLDRDEATAPELLDRARAAGAPAARHWTVDLRSPEAIATTFAEITEAFGRIDALVNNAGIREISSTLDLPVAEWDAVLSVNLTAAFVCSQEAARQMVVGGNGGAIVNISSVSGMVGVPSRPAYCASKHGLIGLSRAMAADLAPHDIRVNVVCPGMAETVLTAAYATSPEMKRALEGTVPMGRTALPEHIADAVVFLTGPQSAFVTGVTLPVDGGFTAVKSYDPMALTATFAAG